MIIIYCRNEGYLQKVKLFKTSNVNFLNEAISLCGFNCGICPAYQMNLKTTEDCEIIDKGWKTGGWVYKDFYCNGCYLLLPNRIL